MRQKRVRRSVTSHAVSRSQLTQVDPSLAQLVDEGLRDHIKPGTQSSYGTATRSWVEFCERRGLQPWPVLEVEFCGWLHVLCARWTRAVSIGAYRSGVRNSSILGGFGWSIDRSELVHRTVRFLKYKYPSPEKAEKVPITVGVIYTILPLLPGWPDMAAMSAEDRVFATATVLGVSGFLRGGEFLSTRKSDRCILMATDITVRMIAGRWALIVSVRQPKKRVGLAAASVPCFENVDNDLFCPVRLWRNYTFRCIGFSRKGRVSPALMLGARALTRDYMVTRTTALMKQANINLSLIEAPR